MNFLCSSQKLKVSEELGHIFWRWGLMQVKLCPSSGRLYFTPPWNQFITNPLFFNTTGELQHKSFHLQHQPCVLQGSALGQIYLMEQTWQHSPGARQRAVPYEQHVTVTWKVCPTALLAKIKRPAYAHLLHIFKSCPLETILEVCFFRRFHFNWQNFPTRLQETQVCLTDEEQPVYPTIVFQTQNSPVYTHKEATFTPIFQSHFLKTPEEISQGSEIQILFERWILLSQNRERRKGVVTSCTAKCVRTQRPIIFYA